MAGEHIADAAAQRDELQPGAAEQLKAQQDGGDQDVGGTAEDGHQPHRRRKFGGQAQQRADHAAEGSAHKEAGHHLAALEPAGKGQRGEEDLAQKIPRQRLSLLHGSGDDAHARAVIAPHAEEIGKADDQHAARKDPHPRVWEKLWHGVLHEVEGVAEQAGNGSAGHTQQDDQQGSPDIQLRRSEGKVGGSDAKNQRAAVGDEGGGKGGDKGRSKGQAHILHHHGKAGRRQRGAEQGGEERSHAADGGGAAVVVLEPQQGAKVPADAAAHLQRSALAAGRAAAQVGEHRAQKDGGHQQNADRLAALHGAENVVGAHALALCYLIKDIDEQTRHRQKEQQPGLRGAQLGGVLNGKVEQGAQKSAEQTHGDCQKEPLQRHPQGGFSFVPECIKIVHRHNSCILTSVPLFGTDIR